LTHSKKDRLFSGHPATARGAWGKKSEGDAFDEKKKNYATGEKGRRGAAHQK